MKKIKQGKDRAFLERTIAGLGESLNRLPSDRQELLDTLDSDRVDEATAPDTNGGISSVDMEPCRRKKRKDSENDNAHERSVKGNGTRRRTPGKPKE